MTAGARHPKPLGTPGIEGTNAKRGNKANPWFSHGDTRPQRRTGRLGASGASPGGGRNGGGPSFSPKGGPFGGAKGDGGEGVTPPMPAGAGVGARPEARGARGDRKEKKKRRHRGLYESIKGRRNVRNGPEDLGLVF